MTSLRWLSSPCSRLALAAAILSLLIQRTAVAQSVVGRWKGTSTCVEAEWNRSCNNEKVVYDIVPLPPNANHVMVHAYKLVEGKADPMGDQALLYSPTGKNWSGEFSNARVHIRWTFEVRGDTLHAQLVSLPDLRVERNAVATRDSTNH